MAQGERETQEHLDSAKVAGSVAQGERETQEHLDSAKVAGSMAQGERETQEHLDSAKVLGATIEKTAVKLDAENEQLTVLFADSSAVPEKLTRELQAKVGAVHA